MTVIVKEMAIESIKLLYFICNSVKPYTLPNEIPKIKNVQKYVNNFLVIIVNSGTPILTQIISSGSGAREIFT
jgi:hypothetical protein